MSDPARAINPDSAARLLLAENAFLRVVGVADATQPYVDGLNDPRVYRFMTATRRSRQTMDLVRAYIRANEEDEKSKLFGLYIDDQLRGTVRLHAIGAEPGTAHIGITIFDPDYWGQGWARRAIHSAVHHGFDDLGLTRVYAGVYADNISSQKAFAHAGFSCLAAADHIDDLGVAQLWVCDRAAP